ncbi:MAG: hypothetical protein ACI9LK_003470, partial [Chromatiales bacterium]
MQRRVTLESTYYFLFGASIMIIWRPSTREGKDSHTAMSA